MTATLFLPFHVAIDGNGNPMAGAKLYFYTTGTTTPQATYTDSDLTTPNTNPVVADSDGLFPPIYLGPGDDYKAILKTSADVAVETIDPIFAPVAAATLPAIRSYLAGLTLSTAGSSTSFGVADGSASDNTNTVTMNLSALTKSTNSWAVGSGNGALDTGTIATSTWYHVFLIQRRDTGVTDVLISTDVDSPTLPTSYTYQRRIGSMKTDGDGNWTKFIQDGDYFQLDASVTDINVTSPGTTATLRTLSVPPDVHVLAEVVLNISTSDASNASNVILADPAVTITSRGTMLPNAQSTSGGSNNNSGVVRIRTNTSSQVNSVVTNSGGASVTLKIITLGWTDRRGKDA